MPAFQVDGVELTGEQCGSLLDRTSALPPVPGLDRLRRLLFDAFRQLLGQHLDVIGDDGQRRIHFVRHAGQVVTRTELAEQVWDLHFDPMTNVIDVTVYHLREKVDRDFKPQLLHTVRGAGYVLKEEA